MIIYVFFSNKDACEMVIRLPLFIYIYTNIYIIYIYIYTSYFVLKRLRKTTRRRLRAPRAAVGPSGAAANQRGVFGFCPPACAVQGEA